MNVACRMTSGDGSEASDLSGEVPRLDVSVHLGARDRVVPEGFLHEQDVSGLAVESHRQGVA